MRHLDAALRIVALCAATAIGMQGHAQTAAPAATEAAPLEMRGYALGDMVLGSPDAPVTIIEYSSLTCGHCGNFHTRTLPSIKEQYIDTGKVRIIFRDVYFDQYGLWASMVARCGGAESFFQKLDVLFARQAEWTRAENIAAELQRIGRLEGLSQERLQACMTDEPFLLRLVEDFQGHMARDNIRATPTFIINGETVTGDRSVAEFSALIDKHL
jgi:protein-disulfide isomerase